MNTIILQIGPLASNREILGGMIAYLVGLISAKRYWNYSFKILNTNVPAIFQKYRILRPLLSITFFYKLFTILIFSKPQIAHVHMSRGKNNYGFYEKILFGLFCRISKVKVIFHMHGANFDELFLDRTYFKILSKIFLIPDIIIVLSESWKDILQANFKLENIIVIPNAINTKLFEYRRHKNESKSTVQILFMGSVGERKGLIELAKAIKLLEEGGIEKVRFQIVGAEEFPGDYRRINDFYLEMSLKNIVEFCGPIFGTEKINKFLSSDIFVLPSRNESFGIANLEAMAAGLPVISTKVGAIPEYLTHGENGFLIDPRDAEKLAKYLKILITDSKKRYNMGKKNREKVKIFFDWDIISLKLSKLYKLLVEKHSK